MNLKESFRYQNFLGSLMENATDSIRCKDHCFKITKKHLRKNANPEAEDLVEDVQCEDFYPIDVVIKFMETLVIERQKLTEAINRAKHSLAFDLDAAVETNKFRQLVGKSIKSMLRYTPRSRVEKGRDYKFNADGNQVEYLYDVEVVSEDAFNRDHAKVVMRSMISDADKTSCEIDAAIINRLVDYEPPFDVNLSFEDVMEEFTSKCANTEE